MPNFNDLLDKDPTTFERPPTLPEGDYLGVIKGKTYGESSKKKTPFVQFQFGVVSPLESVSQEALADIDLTKVKLKDDFYLTEDAMYRLREFLEMADCVQDTTRESIEAAVGQQIVFTIGHETSQTDSSKVYANIRGYAKPE